jgi:hypothetical protein
MAYSVYNYDDLQSGDVLKIERIIRFDAKKADISKFT